MKKKNSNCSALFICHFTQKTSRDKKKEVFITMSSTMNFSVKKILKKSMFATKSICERSTPSLPKRGLENRMIQKTNITMYYFFGTIFSNWWEVGTNGLAIAKNQNQWKKSPLVTFQSLNNSYPIQLLLCKGDLTAFNVKKY